MQDSSRPHGKATVVIPNWNGMRWLALCLGALERQTHRDFAVIVVDNGSTDASVAFVRDTFPAVQVIELGSNTGFAHAVNVGIAASTTPYVALLNTDTEVDPDWLTHLVAAIEAAPSDIAAVSPQMLTMDDRTRIDDAGDELSWYGAATKRGHGTPAAGYGLATEIFSPSAGASLYRRSFLDEAGCFDESYWAYLEDVDLGLRGRLMGYRYIYEPAAKVLHKGHGSNLRHARYVELMTRNRLMLFAKNVPAALLVRHAPRLLWGQVYFFIAYRRPWSSLKGYAGFIAAMPALYKRRRTMLQTNKLDNATLSALLGTEPPRPSLSSRAAAHIARYLGIRRKPDVDPLPSDSPAATDARHGRRIQRGIGSDSRNGR